MVKSTPRVLFIFFKDISWEALHNKQLNHFKRLMAYMYINLKTYQFKTHCKGDRHSSKTANIILPGLMIKQR